MIVLELSPATIMVLSFLSVVGLIITVAVGCIIIAEGVEEYRDRKHRRIMEAQKQCHELFPDLWQTKKDKQ